MHKNLIFQWGWIECMFVLIMMKNVFLYRKCEAWNVVMCSWKLTFALIMLRILMWWKMVIVWDEHFLLNFILIIVMLIKNAWIFRFRSDVFRIFIVPTWLWITLKVFVGINTHKKQQQGKWSESLKALKIL